MFKKNTDRPMVLSIAGFDPSGGAGLLADARVFAHYHVQGQAVCTALTIQNEAQFVAPGWVDWETIAQQLDILAQARQFQHIKIGLVENAAVLARILEKIRQHWPSAHVLWDPIIKASAGFDFHSGAQSEDFVALLRKVNLVTPNIPEAEYLSGLQGTPALEFLETSTDVLLKGGHGADAAFCADTLSLDGMRYELRSSRVAGVERHGSGCTLSAAIAANLALGRDPLSACENAKQLMDFVFRNGSGKLGYIA